MKSQKVDINFTDDISCPKMNLQNCLKHGILLMRLIKMMHIIMKYIIKQCAIILIALIVKHFKPLLKMI